MVSIVPPCFSVPIGVFASSACYALVRQGKVVYVGKSTGIFSRLATHMNNFKRVAKGKLPYTYGGYCLQPVIKFDEVQIYPCLPSDLTQLEIRLIQEFQPRYNKNTKLPVTTEKELKILLDVPAIQALLSRSGVNFSNRAVHRDPAPVFKLKPVHAT
jgi:hypothetical protein